MTRKALEYLVLLACLSLLWLSASAQTEYGAGIGFSGWDGGGRSGKKKAPPPDLYVVAISSYFDTGIKDVHRLWRKGFGRNELIRMHLLVSLGGAEMTDIVKLRRKNTRYKKLCDKYKVDYDVLYEKSIQIRKHIDYHVRLSTSSPMFTSYLLSASTAYISALSSGPVRGK
ncbi:MAG: hypothetical protein JW803_02785 [Endomicrobiales bacterium]|nr:hypothetical protein [Endomicrobiales bacterium]